MSNHYKSGPTNRETNSSAKPAIDREPNKFMRPLNERQLQSEWQRKYEGKAVKHFMRPANKCESCGNPMSMDPQSGKSGYIMDERERKWSVHNFCKNEMVAQLDRSMNQGIGRG